jgi:hypothetical protein
VLISGEFLDFLMSAITCDSGDHRGPQIGPFLPGWGRITAILATLCLCPSAIDPPPISVLLKTKVKPQFDSPVDRTVEVFFPAFQGFNQAQFQPCFLVFAVRSAEGRNGLELPFWLTAEC